MVKNVRFCHRNLFFLLLILLLLSTACSSGELAGQASSFIDPLPTTGDQVSKAKDPAATRRPFPTPLPTEEVLVLPTATATLQVSTEVVKEEVELTVADIVAAHQAALSSKRLRKKTIHENLNTGESQTKFIEFVMPNSFRLVTDELEIIVSNGRTYEKLMGANWLVSPTESMDKFEGAFELYLDDSTAEVLLNELTDNISDVTFVDTQSLGNLETYLVTFTEEQQGASPTVMTKIWIGSEDGLLHREVREFEVDGNNLRITSIYEYGDAVNINPPLP